MDMINRVGLTTCHKISFSGRPQSKVQTKEIPQVGFDIYGNFKPIDINPPMQLTTLLNDIIEERINGGNFFGVGAERSFLVDLKDSVEKSEMKNLKVKQISGMGTSALVFEQEDSDIIKFARNHRYNLNRPHEDFDVPVHKSGKVGKFRYFIEEKCYTHDLPVEFTEIIREKIIQAGYRCRDLEEGSTHQIGMNGKGELYLLDAECARYKTPIHALFANAKMLLKKVFKMF